MGGNGGRGRRRKKKRKKEEKAIPLSTTDRFWRCRGRAGARVPPRGALRPRPGPARAAVRGGRAAGERGSSSSHFISSPGFSWERKTPIHPPAWADTEFLSSRLLYFFPSPSQIPAPMLMLPLHSGQGSQQKNTHNPKPEKRVRSCSTQCWEGTLRKGSVRELLQNQRRRKKHPKSSSHFVLRAFTFIPSSALSCTSLHQHSLHKSQPLAQCFHCSGPLLPPKALLSPPALGSSAQLLSHTHRSLLGCLFN